MKKGKPTLFILENILDSVQRLLVKLLPLLWNQISKKLSNQTALQRLMVIDMSNSISSYVLEAKSGFLVKVCSYDFLLKLILSTE